MAAESVKIALDDAWVAAELAICERASEGPWERLGNRRSTSGELDAIGPIEGTCDCCGCCASLGSYLDVLEDDVVFVEHARTGYPAALKALREAMEALRRCIAAVEGVLEVNPRRDAREVLTDAEFLVHHHASAALAKLAEEAN